MVSAVKMHPNHQNSQPKHMGAEDPPLSLYTYDPKKIRILTCGGFLQVLVDRTPKGLILWACENECRQGRQGWMGSFNNSKLEIGRENWSVERVDRTGLGLILWACENECRQGRQPFIQQLKILIYARKNRCRQGRWDWLGSYSVGM